MNGICGNGLGKVVVHTCKKDRPHGKEISGTSPSFFPIRGKNKVVLAVTLYPGIALEPLVVVRRWGAHDSHPYSHQPNRLHILALGAQQSWYAGGWAGLLLSPWVTMITPCVPTLLLLLGYAAVGEGCQYGCQGASTGDSLTAGHQSHWHVLLSPQEGKTSIIFTHFLGVHWC